MRCPPYSSGRSPSFLDEGVWFTPKDILDWLSILLATTKRNRFGLEGSLICPIIFFQEQRGDIVHSTKTGRVSETELLVAVPPPSVGGTVAESSEDVFLSLKSEAVIEDGGESEAVSSQTEVVGDSAQEATADTLACPDTPKMTEAETEETKPWVALVACGLCVLVFAYQRFIGPRLLEVDTAWVDETFAFRWYGGKVEQWWQWVTGAFLHVNRLHLVGNMAASYGLMSEVENRIGHFSMVGLILLGAIAGNFGELLFQFFSSETIPGGLHIVGFSGVVCAFGGVLLFSRSFLVLLFLLPSFIPAKTVENEAFIIAYGAHFGGFLLGAFFGLISIFAGKRTFLAIIAIVVSLFFVCALLLFLLVALGDTEGLSSLFR